MLPTGPLMIEHRLIERVIALIGRAAVRGISGERIGVAFLDAAVDFIRVYADRTHHGKEEDVLFKTLAEKGMSAEHSGMMADLIEDHKQSRSITGEISSLNEGRGAGDSVAARQIAERMSQRAALYPGHIEKEDKVFFPAAMTYLSSEEKDAMLEEMWEFDREMIHEKYRAVVENLESTSAASPG
jgi:hemerythrin-like domain-containing protein